MGSIVNRYFHQDKVNEQLLLNSLTKESVQINGREYFYLPRDSQVRDLVLGEDALTSFTFAIPLEMYMVDAQGFQGQKEMFSKFGLQINNSYKLVVSVDRWNEEVKLQFDSNTIVAGGPSFTKPNYLRPFEGDLIYDPLTRFLMEIKFVDHDRDFYSLGKNYVYYMSCESFLYQNESIVTNVPEIDLFDGLSKDLLNFQLLLEDGTSLKQENNDYILTELNPTPTRDIEVNFSDASTIINTKITSPFNY